ncbi:hypothetical protein HJC23_002530 [Cyclotella cryptica]|uniref:Uncharacterized protein n=1 Tax=Cyclotella cryptica TaxID=29204 RepID=A0ABD3QZG6_9STRA
MIRYRPPNINFNLDSNNNGSNASKPRGDAYRNLIEEIINRIEDIQDSGDNKERLEDFSNLVNMIVTLVESLVEEAKSMDDLYKKLLGKYFVPLLRWGTIKWRAFRGGVWEDCGTPDLVA